MKSAVSDEFRIKPDTDCLLESAKFFKEVHRIFKEVVRFYKEVHKFIKEVVSIFKAVHRFFKELTKFL